MMKIIKKKYQFASCFINKCLHLFFRFVIFVCCYYREIIILLVVILIIVANLISTHSFVNYVVNVI